MGKNKGNIDLSKFKHVSSDDKSTKLRHADGHFLVLAHGKLGKDFQKQLSALSNVGKESQTSDQANQSQDETRYHPKMMARGGDTRAAVPSQDPTNPKPSPENREDLAAMREKASANSAGAGAKSLTDAFNKLMHPLAEGGSVQHNAEGDQVMPDLSGIDPSGVNAPPVPQQLIGSPQPSMAHLDPEQSVVAPELAKVGQYLMSPEGTPMKPVEVAVPPVNPADIVATKADATVDNLKQQEQSAESVATAAHQQAAAESTPQPQMPKGMDTSPEGLAKQGIEAEIKGQNLLTGAKTELAEKQAQVMENDVKRKQDIAQHYQQSFQQLEGERQAHIKDIQNGYIDPNKYWDSHSKIAAGIGMIIAGFNPTNKPNAAIDFINHQMDMNIEAQKQNLGAKQNLLTANLHQFKNLQDATDMTRIMQADAVKSQLELAAAKSASPFAKAAAQSAIGAIDAKYQPVFMQLQIRHMMQGLGNGGTTASGSTGQMLNGLDVVAPEQAKAYRGRYYAPYDIPGGKSIADREITQGDRAALNAYDKFDQTAKTLHDIVQKNRGNLKVLADPTNPTGVLAKQQAMILQSLFREGTLGTVYREGEQPLLDKAVKGNPLSLVSYFTELPKLEGLIRSNQSMKNTTLESYGLRPPHSAQSQQSQQEQPKTIKGKDGRMYVRQGNYMVPIK